MTVNLIQNDFSTIGERSLADIIGKTKSTILKGGGRIKKIIYNNNSEARSKILL